MRRYAVALATLSVGRAALAAQPAVLVPVIALALCVASLHGLMAPKEVRG